MTLESSIEDVMLGKFIFPEQSKTKANDFVTRVANKKRCLRSSRRLPWSSRTGRQVVSTTIFEWLLNLRLKMWTNYPVITADNLLIIICKIMRLKSDLQSEDRGACWHPDPSSSTLDPDLSYFNSHPDPSSFNLDPDLSCFNLDH